MDTNPERPSAQPIDDEVEIDGSWGEGGGQIIRSALALSLVTGRPVRITRIRAGRQKPGLLRQHLTGVRAAAEVGRAAVDGDALGSGELRFAPSGIVAGHYRWDIGSAGSTTLVAQTVLPALLFADGVSQLTIVGGTHNSMAPPFDFLQAAYLPLLGRLGPRVEANLQQYGFYPAGGGQLTLKVHPSPLRGYDLLERGKLLGRSAEAVVANLPLEIALRELDTVRRRLDWDGTATLHPRQVPGPGPGNAVMIRYDFQYVSEVFTGFGQRGVSAERVAANAVRDARNYLRTDSVLGEYLTDQWLLLLALAVWQTGQAHSFRCVPLSSHSTTHLRIIEQFLGVTCTSDSRDDGSLVVTLSMK